MPPPETTSPDRMHRARRALLWTIAVGLVVTIGFGLVAARTLLRDPKPELPTYGVLPGFTLQDQTGAEVAADDLRGHVVIANFIFTRCDTVCPLFSTRMKKVAARTAGWELPPRLVSFSVDPGHDTPEVLARYAADYDADPARWSFLTGDPGEIRRVVRDGLKIAMEREGTLASGAPNIVHGEHFVLFDRQLRVRGYYQSTDPERVDQMLRHARRLSEAPPSE